MAAIKSENKIKADVDKVKEILKEREWTQGLLAEKMRISDSTLSEYMTKGFIPMAFTMLCMVLGKSEEELTYTEHQSPVKETLTNNEVLKNLEDIKKVILLMREDMLIMADSMSKLERCMFETKGQVDLNAEDIQAINSRTTNMNGSINRIMGTMNAIQKPKAGK